MITYQLFESERCIIRPTNVEDVDFIFNLYNSPKWIANIGDRKLYTRDAALQYIKDKIALDFEKYGYGNYTIINKDSGAKMGICGIYNREGLDGADIGFALLPDYEGKGFAYECSKVVLDASKSIFNLEKIQGITLPSNKGSQKVLEKLGLRFKELIKIKGDSEELMLYVKNWQDT